MASEVLSSFSRQASCPLVEHSVFHLRSLRPARTAPRQATFRTVAQARSQHHDGIFCANVFLQQGRRSSSIAVVPTRATNVPVAHSSVSLAIAGSAVVAYLATRALSDSFAAALAAKQRDSVHSAIASVFKALKATCSNAASLLASQEAAARRYFQSDSLASASVLPLCFASVTQSSSSTPLTVVASGMAKWLELYSGLLLVRVLLSWFPNIDWERQPMQAIRDMSDPYLNLFRNILVSTAFQNGRHVSVEPHERVRIVFASVRSIEIVLRLST